MTTNIHPDQLTEAERNVFNDEAIEAAFQEWAAAMPEGSVNLRKRFLLRVRALFQVGAFMNGKAVRS